MERCRGASAHIAQLLDVFVKGDPQEVHFVLERWAVSLGAYVELRRPNDLYTLPRAHFHHIILGTCSGLDYLHSMSAAHCDLELANILLQTFRLPVPTASASIGPDAWGFHCKVSDLGSLQQVWRAMWPFSNYFKLHIVKTRLSTFYPLCITCLVFVNSSTLSIVLIRSVAVRGQAIVGCWNCWRGQVGRGRKKGRAV